MILLASTTGVKFYSLPVPARAIVIRFSIVGAGPGSCYCD
jgi:hypothetical protein